ncbi:hypothetical protein AALM99_06780 [Lactococcus muris]|uniref:AP2-like integrase N-terminal domain-containing protein n=1 Tax=Lactococcus muris TaxID=2941330 RepID=A0ABV4D8S0_9LACT
MASFRKRGKTWKFTNSRAKENKPPLTKGGFRTKADAIEAADKAKGELKNESHFSRDITLYDYFEHV